MKTKEELIKALQTCVYASECHGCPYELMEGSYYVCINALKRDTLEFLKGEG